MLASGMVRRGRPPDDRGESLIEVLVAVMIMGVGVVVLLGGLGSVVRLSSLHRHQASAGTYLRAYAEAVEAAVNQSPTGYVPCASPASYAGLYDTGDPEFVPRVVSVRYWTGTQFVNACTVPTDSGVQQLVLSIDSSDAAASESLTAIIRRPCRSRADFPADPPCA